MFLLECLASYCFYKSKNDDVDSLVPKLNSSIYFNVLSLCIINALVIKMINLDDKSNF